MPHKGINNKISYEPLANSKVDYSNIHVFRCKVFYYVPKIFRIKYQNNSSPSIFFGCIDNSTTYKIIDLTNNKIIITGNIEIFEFTICNSHLSRCDNDI